MHPISKEKSYSVLMLDQMRKIGAPIEMLANELPVFTTQSNSRVDGKVYRIKPSSFTQQQYTSKLKGRW